MGQHAVIEAGQVFGSDEILGADDDDGGVNRKETALCISGTHLAVY